MNFSRAYLNSFLTVRLDQKKLKCSANSHQCGNACVPKTKRCRPSKTIIRKVEALENKIKDLPYERAISVDPITGKVLLNKGGQQTRVDFTAEEMDVLRGSILTHNHPNVGNFKPSDPRGKGVSFSPDDVRAACILDLTQIRAVSSGYRHTLEPPDAGWNYLYWGFKVKPTYKKHERQVMNDFIGEILSGKKSAPQAEADYHHEVIKRTAQELGMKYERTPIRRK